MDGANSMTTVAIEPEVKPASREYLGLSDEVLSKIAPYLSIVPVPLGKIAGELGVQVLLSTLPRGISGQIGRNDHGRYVIKINRHEARHRQRFTLAHELAHFLLHKDIIDQSGGFEENVLLRSGQPMNIEYQANRLASDLVMPSESLSHALKGLKGPITEEAIGSLAEKFGVSVAAMEIKLQFA